MANGPTPKGSWGDWAVIEKKPIDPNRISCANCVYYNKDGSCSKRPIIIREVGFGFCKKCSYFRWTPQREQKKEEQDNQWDTINILKDQHPDKRYFSREMQKYPTERIWIRLFESICGTGKYTSAPITNSEIKAVIVLLLLREKVTANYGSDVLGCDRVTMDFIIEAAHFRNRNKHIIRGNNEKEKEFFANVKECMLTYMGKTIQK